MAQEVREQAKAKSASAARGVMPAAIPVTLSDNARTVLTNDLQQLQLSAALGWLRFVRMHHDGQAAALQRFQRKRQGRLFFVGHVHSQNTRELAAQP